MKTLNLVAIILCIIFLGSVVFANDPNWNGDPEPPKVEVTVPNTVDGDSDYDPYGRIYYATCTCDDMKVGWGFESLTLRTNKARHQCEIRRTERLNCPEKWK